MKVDFFIVGAPKSGTTSLYKYLNEHPNIFMSKLKEPNYFTSQEIKSQGLYYNTRIADSFSEYQALFSGRKINQRIGEASVSYLFYPKTAHKIYNHNPNAKIIIILRDPAERAYSHYLMDYRLGYVKESFKSIIEKKSKSQKQDLYYQQYISLGMYYNQVKKYIDVFGAQNVYIIDYPNFCKNTKDVIKQVYDFLKLESSFISKSKIIYNSYAEPRFRFISNMRHMIPRALLFKFLPKSVIEMIRRWVFVEAKKPNLNITTSKILENIFKDDMKKLRVLIQKEQES